MNFPNHTERARALCVVLGLLNHDADAIGHAMRETEDGSAFLLALADQFAMLAKRRLEDPAGYLESWIALELQLAEDEHDPPPSQTRDL